MHTARRGTHKRNEAANIYTHHTPLIRCFIVRYSEYTSCNGARSAPIGLRPLCDAAKLSSNVWILTRSARVRVISRRLAEPDGRKGSGGTTGTADDTLDVDAWPCGGMCCAADGTDVGRTAKLKRRRQTTSAMTVASVVPSAMAPRVRTVRERHRTQVYRTTTATATRREQVGR